MIHLPPPIPTPGRLLPVRRRVPPARTPRLWLPRWRRAVPDARVMAWGFKSGHPLFQAGLWCYTCCGGCAATVTGGCNPFYGTGPVPQFIRLTFSGIATHCVNLAINSWADANGATVAGTWTAAWNGVQTCYWEFVETPGSTFNERRFSSFASLGSGSTCIGGTLTSQNNAITASAQLVNISGTQTLRVRLQSTAVAYFLGEVAISGTTGSASLTNSNPSGLTDRIWMNGGGSCTATWCP